MEHDVANENSTGPQSDEALVARLVDGERAALDSLYRLHSKVAKRALLRLAPDCSAAELEELLQDVFLALFSGARRYPPGVGIERWIWGIAAKTALHWRRKTWVRRKLLRMHGDPAVGLARSRNDSPERAVQIRRDVENALGRLPQEQRDVLVLHVAEGFSGEEIAEILGLRHETVRTRLFRARAKLLELIPALDLAELPVGGAP